MDLMARIFAGRLCEILGQPVIVENVGNGIAATSRVAKATPDGYNMRGDVELFAEHVR